MPNPHRRPRSSSSRRAFTLIELLTVIAIIGILAAILVPTVGRVRQSARSAQCLSNLRQIGTAITLYAQEDKDRYPYGWNPDTSRRWSHMVQNYLASTSGRLKSSDAFFCLSEKTKFIPPTNNTYMRNTNYLGNEQIMRDSKGNETKYPRFRFADVARPSHVILVADGTVDSKGGSDWAFLDQPGRDKGNQDLGETVVTDATEGLDAATLAGKDLLNWRHSGKLQVVFCDGHAKAFAVGELKWKNFHRY